MRRLLLIAALLVAVPAGAEDTVESVEVQLLKSEADLRAATARIRELKGRIGRLNADQTAAGLSASERRRRMAVRIRAMYRMRHRGFLPLLFSAALALTGGYATGFLIGGALALGVGLFGLWRRANRGT